jgi:hypothetical protein
MISLLQPIEITADNRTCAVTVGGVGPTAINLEIGSNACILTVLRDLQNKLGIAFGANAPIVVLSTANLVTWHSALALTVTWTDVDLGRLLGFRANLPITVGPCVVAATDQPQRCWFPPLVASERHRWRRDQKRAFAGSQAHDGTLAGVEVGPGVYRQKLVWEDIVAAGALVTAQTDSYVWGATTYYPHEERAWETFLHSLRASVGTLDPSPGITGVYYLPEVLVWETDNPAVTPVTYPASMTSGGIRHELAASPDTYRFAHATPEPPGEPTESLDGSIQFYRVEIELLTAPAPLWDAP